MLQLVQCSRLEWGGGRRGSSPARGSRSTVAAAAVSQGIDPALCSSSSELQSCPHSAARSAAGPLSSLRTPPPAPHTPPARPAGGSRGGGPLPGQAARPEHTTVMPKYGRHSGTAVFLQSSLAIGRFQFNGLKGFFIFFV